MRKVAKVAAAAVAVLVALTVGLMVLGAVVGDDDDEAAWSLDGPTQQRLADAVADLYLKDSRLAWQRKKNRVEAVASWQKSMLRELSGAVGEVQVLDTRETDDGTTAVVEFTFVAKGKDRALKGVARTYWTKHGSTTFWIFGDEASFADPKSIYAAAEEKADLLIRANPTARASDLFDFPGWETSKDPRVAELGGALLNWNGSDKMAVLYAQTTPAERLAALMRQSTLDAFADPATRASMEQRLRDRRRQR